MNCKPGDLAIVVKSMAGNEGKIVRCVKCIGVNRFMHGEYIAWETSPRLMNNLGVLGYAIDDWLRPIRDSDGEDEMLRIAGKPANYKGKVVTTKPAKLDELK